MKMLVEIDFEKALADGRITDNTDDTKAFTFEISDGNSIRGHKNLRSLRYYLTTNEMPHNAEIGPYAKNWCWRNSSAEYAKLEVGFYQIGNASCVVKNVSNIPICLKRGDLVTVAERNVECNAPTLEECLLIRNQVISGILKPMAKHDSATSA